MSSYIMHMCISDIVKRRLNLTEKYVYGSVLPDVLKGITKDRKKTHYLFSQKVNDEVRTLPNIDKAIQELNFEDKEIKLGYISHLIEDYIWFNKYVPAYAKILSDEEMMYFKDGSKHSSDEFRDDIYRDYLNSGAYVIDKCEVDMEVLKEKMYKDITDKKHINLIEENMVYITNKGVSDNVFMTKESIDEYIKETVEEVQKVMIDLLGE